MSYPKKLLKLRPTRGIVLDTPAHEVAPDFYTSGQNVIFRNGFASRLPGSRSVYATALDSMMTDDIQHILNVNLNATNYWLVFGEDEAYSIVGDTDTEITPSETLTAVTAPWQYSSALLNGIPIITNGADELWYWSGTGTLEILTGWTATESCKSVATFKYHIFAFDIDGPGGTFPSLVKWSDAAAPGTIPSSWTPSSSNEAGDVELSDTPGPVLCGVPLRGSLLIYKRNAIYLCDYVGGNQKFAFQKLQSSFGALTRHSVVDIGSEHLVVTAGDIVRTDGTNKQSVGQARMREYLFNDMDQTHYQNLFCVFNSTKGEVLICYPRAGSATGLCDAALVYDIANDSLGLRDLPGINHAAIGQVNDEAPSEAWDDDSGAWDDDSSTWNTATLSAATESLVLAEVDALSLQDTEDATTVAASIGKHDITFDAPERVKFVKRVHVRAKSGFGTLFVRVGARMSPSDTVTWSDEVALTEPEQIVNVFAQGRYISVEVRSNSDAVWTVTGIDIEAEVRGYH